jgi:hypothetical protein
MALQSLPRGLHVRSCCTLGGLQFILRRVQRATRCPHFLHFEDGLDFLGTLCRLNQDEAQDFPPREGDLRMLRNLIERRFHGIIRRHDLGLAWNRQLPRDGRRFAERWKVDAELDKRRVGNFRRINVRTVLRDGQALRSASGEPADLAGETELDCVNDAAFARSIRAGDRERALVEVYIELSMSRTSSICADSSWIDIPARRKNENPHEIVRFRLLARRENRSKLLDFLLVRVVALSELCEKFLDNFFAEVSPLDQLGLSSCDQRVFAGFTRAIEQRDIEPIDLLKSFASDAL